MCVINPVNEIDLEQIINIENECFLDPWSINGFRSEIENPDAYFICSIFNNKEDLKIILGYACMHAICTEGYINKIAVAKEYRNQGIGKKILLDLLKHAQDMNLECVSLEVRKFNIAGISLYESVGFKKIGIRPNFYSFPKEDAVVMRWRKQNANFSSGNFLR